MDRGFFGFPVEIERALPTSMTSSTTTATTFRLIPALSPTQSTTESLPTSSTRLEVVEDVLKGFNVTHLTEFESEYPSLDYTPKIKTENPFCFFFKKFGKLECCLSRTSKLWSAIVVLKRCSVLSCVFPSVVSWVLSLYNVNFNPLRYLLKLSIPVSSRNLV